MRFWASNPVMISFFLSLTVSKLFSTFIVYNNKLMFKNIYLLIVCVSMLLSVSVNAQEDSSRYRGVLPQVDVEGTRDGLNDTMLYRYNQYKYYVQKVWPFVKKGSELLRSIDDNLRTDMSRKERRKYIKSIEQDVKLNFEDRIRKLNRTEGALLVKLMNRQIGPPRTIYSVLRQVKGGVQAKKWQTWANMYGMDLDEVYDPEKEPKLEGVLRSLGYIGQEGVYF